MIRTWEFNRGRIANTAAYDLLRAGYEGSSERIDLSRTGIRDSELLSVVTAVQEDHPLMFHVGETYRYEHSGDKVSAVLPVYTMTRDEWMIRSREVLNKATEIIYPCMGLDPVDRELHVLDYIRRTVVWDNSCEETAHSPVGPLLRGRGVCDGISKATSLLLNLCGVDCSVVSKDGHSWNIVRIDGHTGHLDAGSICCEDLSIRQCMINVPDSESYGLMLGCDGCCDPYRLKGLYAHDCDELYRLLTDHIDDIDGLSMKVWTEDAGDIEPVLERFSDDSQLTFTPQMFGRILSIKT